MRFVQVAVNVPSVAGVFDYAVPEGFNAAVGQLVTVPFGERTAQGVILHFIESPSVKEVKSLFSALDPSPVLSPAQIALAESLSEANLAPLAAYIEMMLPPGLSQQTDALYELVERPVGEELPPLSLIGSRLIKLLAERGPLRGRQLDRHTGRVEWRPEARKLVRQGVLASHPVLPLPTLRPKYIRTAQLGVSLEAAEAAMPALGKQEASRKRRQAALRYLMRMPAAVNVAWVYAESGCKLTDLQELAERDLIVLRETEIWRDPLAGIEVTRTPPPELTSAQRKAWDCLQDGFTALVEGKAVQPFLLQGVTGSGKTELYLRAVEEAARLGRSAIILVPEISLTPQTVHRFLDRFPGQVGLIHSRLSEGERYDTWRRARAGLIRLIIGPRSALFAPLPDLGLIVVDECHDPSYYQSDPPFYHAASAARLYASLAGAVCILGSATPSVVQRHEAESGAMTRLDLPHRIAQPAQLKQIGETGWLPPVSIVDMREELKSGNRSFFSRELLDALRSTLAKDEQAILFLNRRGTATYVFCRNCGYVLLCPRCDSPLTFHQDAQQPLRCHTCGYERGRPVQCPQCSSAGIREFGLGSERVEAEVNSLFPGVRTLRWDWETTRQKDAHEVILAHFANHRADILVGTQMLAKGLDLPLVTLVGVILAEVGLALPDPFAGERVFQLLTQVAGRAGRSSLGGRVIMQTFQPGHEVIQSAARHDYEGFYREELAQRMRLGYPPFTRLARLEIRDADPGRAEQEARQMAARLQEWIEAEGRRETSLIGPAPCYFARQISLYRWQIVVRSPDPASLLRGRVPSHFRLEMDPQNLL